MFAYYPDQRWKQTSRFLNPCGPVTQTADLTGSPTGARPVTRCADP